jgi:aryl-alcohol dehydrogenase-like predicted oxidoreductase
MDMPTRPLGASGIHVSRISLGSWRTYERISRADGLAVMRAAWDLGINFLDDARYDDETGTAPIPTGYSEVVFGELFRAAGWSRAHTIVSNKLWWEFWPQQTAADELDASLERMGFDYVDIIYANPPEHGLGLDELMASVGGLLTSGRARAWAIVNWPAGLVAEAAAIAARDDVPPPCAAQLPYSVVQRSPVEDADMTQALDACGAPVVASYVLAGGLLTGKYDTDPHAGRAAGTLESPAARRALDASRRLRTIAETLGVSAAAVAVAFTLAHPRVATALLGATSPRQLDENLKALNIADQLDLAEIRSTLRD